MMHYMTRLSPGDVALIEQIAAALARALVQAGVTVPPARSTSPPTRVAPAPPPAPAPDPAATARARADRRGALLAATPLGQAALAADLAEAHDVARIVAYAQQVNRGPTPLSPRRRELLALTPLGRACLARADQAAPARRR
jgi:hypothetical protein